MAYTTSGVSSANIAHLQVNSARVPEDGAREVAIKVTQAASLAAITYSGGPIGATPVTIEITGNLGTEHITLASASLANIRDAINHSRDLTGVSATVVSTNVRITSIDYGSSQFVKVRALSGTFTVDNGGTDYGQDVKVNLNGQTVTGSGLKINARTSVLDASVTLAAAFGSVTTGGTTEFNVTGGGANFMISPRLDLNSLATLGLNAVDTTSLGDGNTGYLYTLGTGETNAVSEGNFLTAQRIIRTAISQIATLRGQLGSFGRNTLDTTANALQVQYENVTAAESTIRDTDFAAETANLTRQQILVQAASMVLKQANVAPQSALSLLQQ